MQPMGDTSLWYVCTVAQAGDTGDTWLYDGRITDPTDTTCAIKSSHSTGLTW